MSVYFAVTLHVNVNTIITKLFYTYYRTINGDLCHLYQYEMSVYFTVTPNVSLKLDFVTNELDVSTEDPDRKPNQTRRRIKTALFHINRIVLVPWSSCLGGYLSVPDDYPLVLVCEEHVSSLGVFVA